jgi:hypothetical protein
MRSDSSRRQDFRLAAGVGFCLGVYVVLAVAFHWLMQPTVSENYGVAAYKPPPATIVVYREGPFVPPPPSKLPPSAVAEEPPASAAFAAALPEVAQKPAPAVQAPKKHVARTPPDAKQRSEIAVIRGIAPRLLPTNFVQFGDAGLAHSNYYAPIALPSAIGMLTS